MPQPTAADIIRLPDLKPQGDWTLCGCTVAPGFEFSGFELAPEGWAPG